jgi:hypothetical protein
MSPAAAYDLIRLGEAPVQVEELLGLPPGDHRRNPRVGYSDAGGHNKLRAHHPGCEERSWAFDECLLLILVSEDGVVVAKHMMGGSTRQTFLERLWYRARYGSEL